MAGLAQPTITTQPESQSVSLGANVTFSVNATGTAPLAYQWQKDSTELAGSTETTLVLTNVRSAHAGDYRVVVTNDQGAVTSDVAHLTVLVPPVITIAGQPKDQVVAVGNTASFSVSANGTTPLSYQWRFEGADLPGASNRTLSIPRTQPTNAGAYTVLVANLAGGVTSRIAQLSVAQASVYTNALGAQLPYRLISPPGYEPAKKYPLVLFWHGGGESGTDNLAQLTDHGQFVFLSATNQVQYPCFYLAPQIPVRPSSSNFYTYHLGFQDLAAELLSLLQTQFNIDADRLYVTGLSLGGVNSWAMVARYPNLFAAAVPMSGGWVTNIAGLYPGIRLPVWNFHASDDGTIAVSYSDDAVYDLRNAGGNPIYTRYQTGRHQIWRQAYNTPVLVDWMMAQVRGAVSTNEPLLSITNPTLLAVLLTGATNLNLGGSAGLGRDVTQVTWMNLANNAKGVASGTNLWSASGIALQAGRTNMIVVVGTTTSWAPAYGGNTTFNDTLTVIQSPLSATLVFQGTDALLNWTGGGPPYHVQRATDLAAGDWTDLLSNAAPPLTLPLTGQARFYRIVGQ